MFNNIIFKKACDQMLKLIFNKNVYSNNTEQIHTVDPIISRIIAYERVERKERVSSKRRGFEIKLNTHIYLFISE